MAGSGAPDAKLLEFPNGAGHRGIDTSIEAAEALQPSIGRLQRMVFAAIAAAGDRGMTPDECAAALEMERCAVQPRTTELKVRGWIRRKGEKRFNRTGKRAHVWVAVPEAERVCPCAVDGQAEACRPTDPNAEAA